MCQVAWVKVKITGSAKVKNCETVVKWVTHGEWLSASTGSNKERGAGRRDSWPTPQELYLQKSLGVMVDRLKWELEERCLHMFGWWNVWKWVVVTYKGSGKSSILWREPDFQVKQADKSIWWWDTAAEKSVQQGARVLESKYKNPTSIQEKQAHNCLRIS